MLTLQKTGRMRMMAAVAARAVGRHGKFEQVVAGVIVLNIVVLVVSLIVDGHEELFEVAHNLVLAFFLLELAVRLWITRLGFFRSLWNTADTVVIALSLLPVLGVDASLLRVARLARTVHLLRHVGHLRLARLLVR